MAIDTAAKRRSLSALLPVFGVGVTPSGLFDQEWRQQAGWGYGGILAAAAAAVSAIVQGAPYWWVAVNQGRARSRW